MQEFMRLLPISKCRSGMRLARPIFNDDGLVLLGTGVELTDHLIGRLRDHGVSYLYISDERTDDLFVPELVSPETRQKAVAQVRTSFRQLMGETNRKTTPGLLAKEFKAVLSMIIDDLSSNKDAMIMLMDMNLADHYLYHHSVNVCIYSCLLGMHAGYDRDTLTVLGLGALLHDIGKTKIPLELLNKKGKLTDLEWETIKTHTEYGFLMLKDEPNIPLLAAHCALQHHERLDGSGYPRGLKGDEIHEFAQWIGLTDSYDAMTTHRVYRQTLLPHQALEVLYTGAGTLYNMRMVELFRDKVAAYPLGATVRISTGETGVVVDINASSPVRPIIRVLENERGEPLNEPYEVDLTKQLSIMIVEYNELD